MAYTEYILIILSHIVLAKFARNILIAFDFPCKRHQLALTDKIQETGSMQFFSGTLDPDVNDRTFECRAGPSGPVSPPNGTRWSLSRVIMLKRVISLLFGKLLLAFALRYLHLIYRDTRFHFGESLPR
jgi:hypothetical protein